MSRLIALISILGVIAAAVAGGGVGVALGERASEPGVETLSLLDPALTPDEGPMLRSPGGFTGFEGPPALPGRVVRTGEFMPGQGDVVQITGRGSMLQVQVDSPSRLLRLVPLARSLAPGDIVLVRYEEDVPVGILRVPDNLSVPVEAGG